MVLLWEYCFFLSFIWIHFKLTIYVPTYFFYPSSFIHTTDLVYMQQYSTLLPLGRVISQLLGHIG